MTALPTATQRRPAVFMRLSIALVILITIFGIARAADAPRGGEGGRLPGLHAPPCGAIFGEPPPGSDISGRYHMFIAYRAIDAVCYGPAARDVTDDPAATLGSVTMRDFIVNTVEHAQPGESFVVLVGVEKTDPTTDKTVLVPSILTIAKTPGGRLRGFKIIESRRLEKGRFVADMHRVDIENLLTGQLFVLFARIEDGAARENVRPVFFQMMISPYIEYLRATANLECSNEQTL